MYTVRVVSSLAALGVIVSATLSCAQDTPPAKSAAKERGYIGVSVQPMTREQIESQGEQAKAMLSSLPAEQRGKVEKMLAAMRPGLVVAVVLKEGPADKAGLKPGDTIVGIAGHDEAPDALATRMSKLKIGKSVKVKIARIAAPAMTVSEEELSIVPVEKKKLDGLEPVSGAGGLGGLLGGGQAVQAGGDEKPAKPKHSSKRDLLGNAVVVEEFDHTSEGELPDGWKGYSNGQSPPQWKVGKVEGGSGTVLTLETTQATPADVNVCVFRGVKFGVGHASVRLHATDGVQSRCGGVVMSYASKRNFYYIALDAKQNRVECGKMVDGTLTPIDTKEFQCDPARWYKLSLERFGERLIGRVDENVIINTRDGTFKKDGRVGVFTRGDAVVGFDSFEAAPIIRPAGGT
ncbi:MAG: PDZ domain-containing protein [Phycisphaerae bacterium]